MSSEAHSIIFTCPSSGNHLTEPGLSKCGMNALLKISQADKPQIIRTLLKCKIQGHNNIKMEMNYNDSIYIYIYIYMQLNPSPLHVFMPSRNSCDEIWKLSKMWNEIGEEKSTRSDPYDHYERILYLSKIDQQ